MIFSSFTENNVHSVASNSGKKRMNMIVFYFYSLFLNKHVLHVDDDPCYASTDDKYGQLMKMGTVRRSVKNKILWKKLLFKKKKKINSENQS